MSISAVTNSATPQDEDGQHSFADLARRARGIAEHAKERAAETDALRRVPDSTIAELWDAGLMRLRQPQRFGGYGGTTGQLFEIAMALGQGCASTGWVYTVLAGHAETVTEFPLQAQEEVWGADPTALVCSAFAPTGQATLVEGGYRLSGRFPFSSGSDHASWALLGAITVDAEGRPAHSVLLVPLEELSIDDDWYTLGLIGTGSKTVVADDVFVPSHRVTPFPPFLAGAQPFGLQAPIVGAALGGLKSFIAGTKSKPMNPLSGILPKDSDHIQTAVGTSYGEVQAAWQVLTGAVERLDSPVPEDANLRNLAIAKNRAASATISRLTLSAVERVFELSGGHGIYVSHLSRVLRDVRSGTQHPAANPYAAGQMAGSLLFSLD